MLETSLYLRLSAFYLVYFATLGVMLPYWSLYLQSLGFDPVSIGSLTAIILATKVVAPNIWGWIADHTGRRMSIIRTACLATIMCFSGVYLAAGSFAGIAVASLLFSFFWNAALPQFEVTTLNHLGKDIHQYSRIRLWGSAGFIAMAVVVGMLIQLSGVGIVPAVLLGLFVLLWLNSLLVSERTTVSACRTRDSLSQVVCQPQVLALFSVCFLIQASHGPYYTFFSIYLEGMDYSRSLIGWLWGLAVLAEIGVFMLMPRLLPRFGARQLMLVTLLMTSVRWLIIGYFAESISLLVFAQILHAFSFGVYHAVAIYLIHYFFTGSHQGRGQALYSSVSFGAGGAVGSLAAGYLWTSLGPAITYALAASLSMFGFVLAWRGLRL